MCYVKARSSSLFKGFDIQILMHIYIDVFFEFMYIYFFDIYINTHVFLGWFSKKNWTIELAFQRFVTDK